MTEPIRIDPQVLREAAGGHDDVARGAASARERGGDVLAAVQTYGPIMDEVKTTVGDLLVDRDSALGGRVNLHHAASDRLRAAVHTYTGADDDNAVRIKAVIDP